MNYIFKFLTIYFSFTFFIRRKILIKNIEKDDLVLDVGSGDKPFWRADVIVDKYLKDDQQRHSGEIVYDKRKIFLEADVENLPFKDKSFDFIFCSHLLEHVKNPDKAISEMVRVAKRGYIEVPQSIVDLFKPFPPHLWFCDYRDGTLIFRQKEQEKNFFIQNTETFGNFFYWNPIFQYLLTKFQSEIFICLYWEKTVRYKVVRLNRPYLYKYKKDVFYEKNILTKISFFIYKMIYEVMILFFYKQKEIKINNLLKKNVSNK